MTSPVSSPWNTSSEKNNMNPSELNPSDVITFIREHPEELADALSREHRTHQQSTGTSILKILEGYAKQSDISGWDLRNEAFVMWAKKITKEQIYFPFL
jgi:hypothetical protein